ncbi:hypothetical protein GUJ93_ZPchr0169g29008 [Zizania palustris]|uniref:Uncharacterized protein n=1 Tax=Zizania palustris TaxID=103762 RepID=A0A8J5X5W8_ZIZPA|nr:hypothetical protein GUJ93_ZPchr0169g29008 [Zizania palustris]
MVPSSRLIDSTQDKVSSARQATSSSHAHTTTDRAGRLPGCKLPSRSPDQTDEQYDSSYAQRSALQTARDRPHGNLN